MTTTGDLSATVGETPVETPVESGVPETRSPEWSRRACAHARARVRHLAGHPVVSRVWDVAVGEVPSVWSQAPATPAELVRYARDGAWCAPESTRLRTAGRVYSAVVAIPVTVAAYLTAWVVQRPGRLAAVVFLAAVIALSYLVLGS